MKKVYDVGLQYILKLGLTGAKDAHGIWTNMVSKFGESEAASFLDTIEGYQDLDDNHFMLYEFKNKEFDKGLFYTGLIDADIFRKACNWIADHKMSFGKTILDVGCDCGVMTCFLGMMFPESQITAIDRRNNSITMARTLAKKLNISNIQFENVDLTDLGPLQYDTVFTMRTFQENRTDESKNVGTIQNRSDDIKEGIYAFVELLTKHVKPEGNNISIMRTTIDPFLLAYLDTMSELGYSLKMESYKELICKEVGTITHLQVCECEPGTMTKDDVRKFWSTHLSIVCEHNYGASDEYYSWAADYLLEGEKEKELYKGIHVLDDELVIGRFELYSVKDKYYFYVNNGSEELHLLFIDENVNARDSWAEQIDDYAKINEKSGFKIKWLRE